MPQQRSSWWLVSTGCTNRLGWHEWLRRGGREGVDSRNVRQGKGQWAAPTRLTAGVSSFPKRHRSRTSTAAVISHDCRSLDKGRHVALAQAAAHKLGRRVAAHHGGMEVRW